MMLYRYDDNLGKGSRVRLFIFSDTETNETRPCGCKRLNDRIRQARRKTFFNNFIFRFDVSPTDKMFDGRPTAVRWPSDDRPTAARRPSNGRRTAVGRPSDGCQMAVRRPSDGHHRNHESTSLHFSPVQFSFFQNCVW